MDAILRQPLLFADRRLANASRMKCVRLKFIVCKCMQSEVFAPEWSNLVFGLVDRESSESHVFV